MDRMCVHGTVFDSYWLNSGVPQSGLPNSTPPVWLELANGSCESLNFQLIQLVLSIKKYFIHSHNTDCQWCFQ